MAYGRSPASLWIAGLGDSAQKIGKIASTYPYHESNWAQNAARGGIWRRVISVEPMQHATTRIQQFSLLAVLLTLSGSVAFPRNLRGGEEWMTWPSTYTHSDSGERVDQYAEHAPSLATVRTDFQRSGMRHYRSTLQAGLSSDNLHIVEQWGRQVVPYEQWRFPYRPYGVPYNQWGPQAPYGIINGQFGGGYPYPAPYRQPYGPGQGNIGNPTNRPGGIGSGAGVQPGYVPNRPAAGYFGPGYQGQYGNGYQGYPNTGNPYQGYPRPGYPQPSQNGFPLTPPYTGQPWFDGNYQEAPPLRRR